MSDQNLHEIIDDALSKVGSFGTISLTLKVAQDNVVTVDLTKIARRKVTGNAQALTLIGSLLKLLGEANTTGDLTFTISLQKGEAIQLMTHDFDRKNLRGESYQ